MQHRSEGEDDPLIPAVTVHHLQQIHIHVHTRSISFLLETHA